VRYQPNEDCPIHFTGVWSISLRSHTVHWWLGAAVQVWGFREGFIHLLWVESVEAFDKTQARKATGDSCHE